MARGPNWGETSARLKTCACHGPESPQYDFGDFNRGTGLTAQSVLPVEPRLPPIENNNGARK